jgi:predicted RND superfamily exporter protein
MLRANKDNGNIQLDSETQLSGCRRRRGPTGSATAGHSNGFSTGTNKGRRRSDAGGEALNEAKAATSAYTSTAFPMLTGTLVTIAGFVPIGFAKSAAGEYTFSLFAVVVVLFAPLIGVTILPDKIKHTAERNPAESCEASGVR